MSSFKVLMKFGFVSALGLAGAGVLAVGCGGGVDLSTEQAFCAAVAQTDCNGAVVQACYMPSSESQAADAQECVNLVSSAERCNPGNFPYNPNFAQNCLNAHAALYGGAPTIDPNLKAALVTACNAVFNNNGMAGTECKADTDCDVGDGYLCVAHSTGSTCQIPVAIQPGESCTQPADQCGTGFYCDASQHCVSNPTPGQPCGVDIPCDSSSFCDFATAEATTGSCAIKLADQSSCNADVQCQGGFCDAVNGGSLCAGSPAPLTFAAPSCTTTFAP